MKTAELRSKSVEELNTQLQELLQEQFNLRMQKGLGDATKTNNFRENRRNVARIKTILKEKMRESHE